MRTAHRWSAIYIVSPETIHCYSMCNGKFTKRPNIHRQAPRNVSDIATQIRENNPVSLNQMFLPYSPDTTGKNNKQDDESNTSSPQRSAHEEQDISSFTYSNSNETSCEDSGDILVLDKSYLDEDFDTWWDVG